MKNIKSPSNTDSQNYLEHVLRTAYMFAYNESNDFMSSITCDEMMSMLCDALCNEFGPDRFSDWRDKVDD